jgi:hypothetical protein
MSNSFGPRRYRARRTLLAATMGFALTPAYPASEQLGGAKASRPAQSLPVTRCDDDLDQGTLRWAITFASSGDTVDLSALACSTITLSGVEIVAPQDFLYIKGPTSHELTIDAAFNSRVFAHQGAVKIEISDLTMANGHHFDDASPRGGCLYSESSIVLQRSKVTNCSLATASTTAYGGGIATMGDLFLYNSTISFSYAAAGAPKNAEGGGAWVHGDLRAFNSVIDSNAADDGGGLYVKRSMVVVASTISRNWAARSGGGVELDSINMPGSNLITNSTISGNYASTLSGGVYAAQPLIVSNSTIAFNRSGGTFYDRADGITMLFEDLTVQSSIIAENKNGAGISRDLSVANGGILSMVSAKNLITSSNVTLPMDTITQCAKLQPLAKNGGPTPTHGVSADSFAINKGSDDGLSFDQRGLARVVDGVADIGAVERQADEIDERVLENGFDLDLCAP